MPILKVSKTLRSMGPSGLQGCGSLPLRSLYDPDPRGALLVAVCASNSFVLPTHQVNALFMSPGGYRNADYIRDGGIMSFIFLAIAVGAVWLLFV